MPSARQAALLALLLAGCSRSGFGGASGGDRSGPKVDRSGPREASPAADRQRSLEPRPPEARSCTLGPFGNAVLMSSLSGVADEFSPAVSADELQIIFQRSSGPSGVIDITVWQASRSSKATAFGQPNLLPFVQPASEPGLSADGKELFLTGNNHLLISTPSSSDWSPPQAAVFANPVPSLPGGPFLDADGISLWLHVGSPPVLAMAKRQPGSSLFALERYFQELSSPAGDGWPAASGDGLEIFFESNRVDPKVPQIFRATRSSTSQPFAAPLQLAFSAGSPLVSAGDPELSRDGRTLYFSAKIAQGTFDLYYATRTCQ